MATRTVFELHGMDANWHGSSISRLNQWEQNTMLVTFNHNIPKGFAGKGLEPTCTRSIVHVP
jgi:hypothetical protein